VLSCARGLRPRPTPMLVGPGGAGVVVGLGDGVAALAVGQQVVTVFLPRCGECANCRTNGKLPCTLGSATNNAGTLPFDGHRVRLHDRTGAEVAHHLGASVFATHAGLNRASVVPADDGVPPPIAAVLGCAVLAGGGAERSARRPDPRGGRMVVRLGGGGTAALAPAVSRAAPGA